MKYADKKNYIPEREILSLGATIPEQLSEETSHALLKMKEALHGDVSGYVANRLNLSPEELAVALAQEQVEGVALAIYNIEARSQSVIIGDQTGIGKGRQAAAMIRYGMLAGYLPIFLTDRYTLFSDMYRDCKALGIMNARPLILNQKVSVVDFDKIIEGEDEPLTDEIWSPNEDDDDDGEAEAGLYQQHYEEIYKSPKKAELDLMYRRGDIETSSFEYLMLTYSQLKDAKRDMTRLDFLTSLCEKHRVLFIFDEAHKSSSVTAGKISVITQGINSILEQCPKTQCVFLSATFAKRPECLITFMRQTMLSSLATNDTLKLAFANGGVPMQEYVASKLANEGQMIRREHSTESLPEPTYTYLDDKLVEHAELFDKVMYWFREMVKLSDMIKELMVMTKLLEADVFRPYPTRAQLFYVNKVLLLSLKARDVAEAAVREVRAGRSVVIGMSDTLECVLRDSIDPITKECRTGDFSTMLLRLLDKTLSNPKVVGMTVFDLDLDGIPTNHEIFSKLDDVRTYSDQIRDGILEDIFHLPLSPIDVIRQLITQEEFTDKSGVTRNIRFEECTGRARQVEYLSPEGDDEYVNAIVVPRKKRHSNHIYNDFQNNKLDVILINACGAIGASAHAVETAEVQRSEVRQRKMLIVQNDLDVNIDLQKRGRINRTGQVEELPPLYEYIITAIPSEKRLNMMLRAKLRSLSANTAANQDQDKRQADFIDISNRYGNQVTTEFLSNNTELAFVLGLKGAATASQLLARVAMLSVTAQQDIIDEIFSAYQNLEQELRRINQWDLARDYRDFEAEFVKEELFTKSVDESALGSVSMLSTFRCRHRTFPYDAASLVQAIAKSKAQYGAHLSESGQLKDEISAYYRRENKKIRDKIKARKETLWALTLKALCRYIPKEEQAIQFMLLAQHPAEFWLGSIDSDLRVFPKQEFLKRKLLSYSTDFADLYDREKKELKVKSEQRKRLMEALSKAAIGQGFGNILDILPLDEKINRVIAVLKEVRFDKNEARRFQPGKVQFVFALSAGHKELVLNLVDKGSQNDYARLMQLLDSPQWNFNPLEWDREIAKYNNRILDRKIITGNILGAYSNPLVASVKPRFITFSLAPDKDGVVHTEQGLLLPMSGENVEKLASNVALPLVDGLKYANAANHVYQISGIGVGFCIIPMRNLQGTGLTFCISVTDKDSKKFESDTRFDSIRGHFKATAVTSMRNKNNASAKNPLKHYATDRIASGSAVFVEVMTLLASLNAVILIPREYLTVGEMNGHAKSRKVNESKHWPKLDWQASKIMPPVRKEIEIRISAPVSCVDEDVQYVDEYTLPVQLCLRTLNYEGRSFTERSLAGQIRALYFEWPQTRKTPAYMHRDGWNNLISIVRHDLHRILMNAGKEQTVKFDEDVIRRLKAEIAKEQLSAIGKTVERYKREMLFLAPPAEEVQKFLDNSLCHPRLGNIRKSLENYLSGKNDIIIDV
ncbi:MAG: strawberry notch family protein [Muribaculaceae bacterium]|nr:strawberry notch family protein [Muribaculaceae bacterium]